LVKEGEADRFTELMLRDTTALGVRRYLCERRKLRREIRKVKTQYGEIEMKIGLLNGKVVQASPEFESCKIAADANKMAIKTIYESALLAFRSEERR
jgi:pyridinium-3,5-bisthiocarboxylic acid mononucleotide nickel chelatase